MVRRVSSTLVLLVLVLFTTCYVSNSHSKLVSLVEVCRHGARAVDTVAFPDPGLTHYDVPNGELTAGGMRMHYLIGYQLRQTLIEQSGFLDKHYNISQIFVQSSDHGRTLQSAQSQLLGLYPLGSGPDLWDEEMREVSIPPLLVGRELDSPFFDGLKALPHRDEPVPVVSMTPIQDFLLQPDTACLKLAQLQQERSKDPVLIEYFNTTIAPLLPEIEKVTKVKIDGIEDTEKLESIFNEFYCGIYAGKKMPEGATAEFLKKINDLPTYYFYHYLYGTQATVSLAVSEMFSKIQSVFNNSIAGRKEIKFWIFSAHDNNIAALLAGLQQEPHFPGFASTLFWELHQDDESLEYYVKVKLDYNYLELPGCDRHHCSIDQFNSVLNAMIVPNLQEACKIQQEDSFIDYLFDFLQ